VLCVTNKCGTELQHIVSSDGSHPPGSELSVVLVDFDVFEIRESGAVEFHSDKAFGATSGGIGFVVIVGQLHAIQNDFDVSTSKPHFHLVELIDSIRTA